MKKIILSLALASLAGNALAVPVTIDTDSYAVRTNVSHVDDNTSIQAINYTRAAGFKYSDVYVGEAPTMDVWGEQPFDAEAGGFGSHAFARMAVDQSLNPRWGQAFYYPYARTQDEIILPNIPEINVLGIQFFEPVRYVELRSLVSSDMGYVMAYDITGNLIASLTQNVRDSSRPGGYLLQDLVLSRDQADIAYVVYGGTSSPSRLNQITYDVPAPSGLMLLVIGLLFGGALSSRKTLN